MKQIRIIFYILLALFVTVKSVKSYFLPSIYRTKQLFSKEFVVLQVPGDGSCLFNALATWVNYIQTGECRKFNSSMNKIAKGLRELAVDVLQRNMTFILEDGEKMDSITMLETVGDCYNMTGKEYCDLMLDSHTWGGGPEIVALSNRFQIPIYVYQLQSTKFLWWKWFNLKLCAKFGSPDFETCPPIHILNADGRFPNVTPGEHKSQGDHFLAMFPKHIHLKKKNIRSNEFLHPSKKVIEQFLSSLSFDREIKN